MGQALVNTSVSNTGHISIQVLILRHKWTIIVNDLWIQSLPKSITAVHKWPVPTATYLVHEDVTLTTVTD